ncbi:platelet endothelial cell adhesion molecule isoform X2 [Brienomyrus brachyistius]|uniref:platelet endothelial cell adhesion molecule isoform X2 n=1 Tax=Brienomyrus brachyistius TaxID=42636 RepID=UPI0020B25A5D|nr:platelet endothelial cell adhesion molecule isoform X2 [Brienomyrus brachyistius]
MWETPGPLFRMRSRPLLVLLILHTFLLSSCALLNLTWQGTERQGGVYILPVKITLEPRGTVKRGEYVAVVCEGRVSYTSQVTRSHKVTFFKDGLVVDTKETQHITVSYNVTSARVSHSGRYKCRVEAEGEKMDSSEVPLTVTGLQTPEISVSNNQILESQGVTATCHARDELGAFNFYFYENDNEIQHSKSAINEVEVQLTFTPGRKTLRCQYAVQLTDNFVKSEMSENITIDVKELSIKPDILVWPNRNVVEGDHLEVNCTVSGSNSGLKMLLLKDQWGEEGNNTVSRKLRAKPQDSGLYHCVLKTGNVLKTASANVSVTELFSEPVLTTNPPLVFEGMQFNFNCSSKTIMTGRISHGDVTYTIYKDGRSFMGDSMMKAGKSLDGNYSCLAVARGISKSSRDFIFKAKELVSTPKIEVMDKVVLGKTFRIRCRSERGSLPIRYTLKQGPRWVGNETVSQPLGYAFFNVTIKNEGDNWEFSCHVQNDGPREDSSKHRPEVIVPPTKVTISLRDAHIESNEIEEGNIEEGDTLKIYCSVQKGSHPITFSWYRYRKNQQLYTEKVYDRSGVYEVKWAGREHEGGYYCDATNQSDMGEKSRVLIIQVKMASWKKGLIAVSCILALAVIVGVVWYKVKRGQRMVVTDLSVKPSSATPDDSVTVRLQNNANVYYSQVDTDVAESSIGGRSSSDTASCRKGTDTVYSELQNSCQGAECSIGGVSETASLA